MTNDWHKARLGNLLRRVKEEIKLEDDTTYKEVTIRLWNKGVILRDEKQGIDIKTNRFSVRAGQLILSRIDVRNGAIGIVPSELDGAVVSGEFWTYAVDKTKMDSRFLALYVSTPRFLEESNRTSSGTTHRIRAEEENLLQIEIPLPPLTEQQRIVARVDTLARRVEEARGLRRAAVKEAETLFYAAARRLREKLASKTRTKQLGDITTVTSGGTPDRSNPEYWDGGIIPWIKTGELYDNPIYNSEEKITEKAVQNSSARLFPIDTVLIALYGQGQTRGRTGLLKIPATTNQGSAAVLPQPEIFESRYLQYWLQSLYYEMREENHGGAQPNWNGGMIKQIVIALPPLADQRRIVAYLDGLQAKVDELRRLQAATQKEMDALMPSILAKAFAGEL